MGHLLEPPNVVAFQKEFEPARGQPRSSIGLKPALAPAPETFEESESSVGNLRKCYRFISVDDNLQRIRVFRRGALDLQCNSFIAQKGS